MSVKPYLISGYETGKETDLEPWLLPEEAFPIIEDAYSWRKRVKRRPGNDFLGRLVQQASQIYPLAITNADITYTNTTALFNLPVRPFSVTISFDSITITDDGQGNLSGTGGSTGTIDYNTGIFTINFTAIGIGGPYNLTVTYSYYPNTSVMGLCSEETISVTTAELKAFNLTKANLWNPATLYFDDISFYDHSLAPVDWHGADFDFFDYENYQGAFFATNNLPGYHVEQISSTAKGATTTTFTFTANIMDVGDQVFIKNLIPGAGDTVASLANLNDHSFPITAANQTTITIAYPSGGLANNPTGGTAFMPQHSGFDVAQVITGITPGTTTTITFATNAIAIGNTVYIKWVDGTIGAVLNNKEFIVTNAVAGAGGSITINVDSTGLTWGTTAGLVVRPGGDGIRFYANDSSINGWVNFNPPLNNVTALKGGKILLSFKDRLLVFAPFEGSIGGVDAVQYNQRVRWSQNGTVYYSTPVPLNQTADGLSWRDDIPGRGGFVDAPTAESIVSVEFIRDQLVVFFERTTWGIVYTSDPSLPFRWVRINAEFGSQSPFSIIPFDRGVLAIGNRGIITADGNNVARVDLKIPDETFDFSRVSNNNLRIHGIRDYFNELVYWTYLDTSIDTDFPNKLLVYNYRENSYSNFNDSYTCFGYWIEASAQLWQTDKDLWQEANYNWNSSEISQDFPSIVAGTNTGYVMILGNGFSPDISNDTQISIASITQAPQAIVTTNGKHNLIDGQFVTFANVLGMTQINNRITEITVINATQFQCIDIDSSGFGTYTFAGDIIRINNFNIITKQFNPFTAQGLSVFMNKLDLYTDFVVGGQIAINIYVNGNLSTALNEPYPGQPPFWQFLFPLDEQVNAITPVDKIWNRLFAHIRGQFLQLQFTMTKAQMLLPTINRSPFVLHAMLLYMGPAGRLISR